jgi:hypothetical protein
MRCGLHVRHRLHRCVRLQPTLRGLLLNLFALRMSYYYAWVLRWYNLEAKSVGITMGYGSVVWELFCFCSPFVPTPAHKILMLSGC